MHCSTDPVSLVLVSRSGRLVLDLAQRSATHLLSIRFSQARIYSSFYQKVSRYGKLETYSLLCRSQCPNFISIGTTEDVNAEVGLASQGSRRPNSYGISPQERQAYFGELIAPLFRVRPPLQQNGRNDPIAQLGRGLASRTNQKKIQKADKDMAKGKTKNMDSLEGGFKWVRRMELNFIAILRTVANSHGSSLLDKPLQVRWRTGGTLRPTTLLRDRHTLDRPVKIDTVDSRLCLCWDLIYFNTYRL